MLMNFTKGNMSSQRTCGSPPPGDGVIELQGSVRNSYAVSEIKKNNKSLKLAFFRKSYLWCDSNKILSHLSASFKLLSV